MVLRKIAGGSLVLEMVIWSVSVFWTAGALSRACSLSVSDWRRDGDPIGDLVLLARLFLPTENSSFNDNEVGFCSS